MAFRRPDVDELLEELTTEQLVEWRAYYELCPFGQDYTDYLLAQLTYYLSAAHGGKPKSPTDFLPMYERPEMTGTEISSVVKGHLRRWQSSQR